MSICLILLTWKAELVNSHISIDRVQQALFDILPLSATTSARQLTQPAELSYLANQPIIHSSITLAQASSECANPYRKSNYLAKCHCYRYLQSFFSSFYDS